VRPDIKAGPDADDRSRGGAITPLMVARAIAADKCDRTTGSSAGSKAIASVDGAALLVHALKQQLPVNAVVAALALAASGLPDSNRSFALC
jgi:hypothetical protein